MDYNMMCPIYHQKVTTIYIIYYDLYNNNNSNSNNDINDNFCIQHTVVEDAEVPVGSG